MGAALSTISKRLPESAAGSLPAKAGAALRGAAHSPVEPDIELVEGVIDQLELVDDTGARKRVRNGLSDFRRMYLGTFVAHSRVSVFELYDCMRAVSVAFERLQYDCGWGSEATVTIAWARNLAVARMQACTDEAVARTGMVDPRPFTSDPSDHDQYMQLIRSWPTNDNTKGDTRVPT